jgi:hypothetical protein
VNARAKLRQWVRRRDKSLRDEGWLGGGNPYNNIRHLEIEQAIQYASDPAPSEKLRRFPQLVEAPPGF